MTNHPEKQLLQIKSKILKSSETFPKERITEFIQTIEDNINTLCDGDNRSMEFYIYEYNVYLFKPVEQFNTIEVSFLLRRCDGSSCVYYLMSFELKGKNIRNWFYSTNYFVFCNDSYEESDLEGDGNRLYLKSKIGSDFYIYFDKESYKKSIAFKIHLIKKP